MVINSLPNPILTSTKKSLNTRRTTRNKQATDNRKKKTKKKKKYFGLRKEAVKLLLPSPPQ